MKTFKEEYDASPIIIKRAIVLELLESLRERGKVFNDFFEFISRFPDDMAESELDEIFRVILSAIYIDSKEKFQETESKLAEMKNAMEKMKERELTERNKENPEEEIALQFSLV